MDNNYPEIADPRPKRRKNKDNPYTIYSVGLSTDHPRYFVEFDDGEGIHQCVELDERIFKAFDQFELEDLAQMNEAYRHYGGSEFSEVFTEEDTTAETVIARMQSEHLHSLIDMLPEIQKRRLKLYYFENCTYQQIGEMEGRSYVLPFGDIRPSFLHRKAHERNQTRRHILRRSFTRCGQ